MAKDKKDQEETKKEKDQDKDKKPVRGPFHDWTEEDARF